MKYSHNTDIRLINKTHPPKKKKKHTHTHTKQILSITPPKKKKNAGFKRKKKKKTWRPKLNAQSREGPNKQSYLKLLTNKMAQIFIILYLIPDTVRWAVESWERRRAENQREAEDRVNSGDWRVERKVKFLGFWFVIVLWLIS